MSLNNANKPAFDVTDNEGVVGTPGHTLAHHSLIPPNPSAEDYPRNGGGSSQRGPLAMDPSQSPQAVPRHHRRPGLRRHQMYPHRVIERAHQEPRPLVVPQNNLSHSEHSMSEHPSWGRQLNHPHGSSTTQHLHPGPLPGYYQDIEENRPPEKQRPAPVRKLTWSQTSAGNPMQQYGCMPLSLASQDSEHNRSYSKLTKLVREDFHAGKTLPPASEVTKKKGMSSGSVLLVLYTLGMLSTSVINSLYFKKMTSAMPNYSAFLNQATSVIYIPLFGFVCLYLYFTYGADGLGGAEVVAFPIYKFATMGILDGAASVLMMIGGTYTTGSSQVVLSQMVIPVTLVTCYFGLGRKYHKYQYIGSLIIMAGVAVTKLKSGDHSSSASLNTSDKLAYNLVFMFCTIPAAFSALYKELAFNDVEMNVNYMQFWVALWQFIVGFMLVPMQSLPLLGPQRVPLSEMPESLKDGLLCLVTGHNTIVTNCGGPNQPQCDNCGVAWLPVLNYCLANIAYNVFSLLVVKHGGATISFLVSTLRLPLTTICFSSVWFMGRGNTTQPTIFDYAGLGVLFLGLCAYRYGSLRKSSSIPPGMKQIHLYTTTLDADPIIMTVPKHGTKTAMQLRNQLYNRLSIVDPLLNPETRAMYTAYTPPKLPDQISDYLPEALLQRYNHPPEVPSLSAAGPAVPWDPDYLRTTQMAGVNDCDSIYSSKSRDPISEAGASGVRQSQRQRWIQQLAQKYGGGEGSVASSSHYGGGGRRDLTRAGSLGQERSGFPSDVIEGGSLMTPESPGGERNPLRQ